MTAQHDTMDPLTQFEEEHRHALHELVVLESAIDGLEHGAHVEPLLEAVSDVCDFLTTAVREHNEREERALFPLLGEEAPTALFIEEHRRLRSLEDDLRNALASEDPETAVVAPGREIVYLLRAHITREDEALFPMARVMLGPDGLARVGSLLS
jgi:hemerythrin-like domain-containing protein